MLKGSPKIYDTWIPWQTYFKLLLCLDPYTYFFTMLTILIIFCLLCSCLMGYVNNSLSVFDVKHFENETRLKDNGSESLGFQVKYCRYNMARLFHLLCVPTCLGFLISLYYVLYFLKLRTYSTEVSSQGPRQLLYVLLWGWLTFTCLSKGHADCVCGSERNCQQHSWAVYNMAQLLI